MTNRLRYYSYFCWVARRYEHAHHADDEQRWSRFIRRAEALFALATQLADIEGTDGLAGSDWATDMLNAGVTESFDLRRHTDSPGERGVAQYLQARFGNFGQFYKRSMTEVGFLDASERIPIVNKRRGDPLADAFEESIGAQNRQLVIAALDSGRVRKSDLLKIGNAMHPAKIDARSREMRLLREFLLVDTPDAQAGTHRRSTAWLLLDLVRKGVALGQHDHMRRAFYHRKLPGNREYRTTGQTIDRWRAYQANEVCHVALNLWLNAIALRVDADVPGVDPDTVIADLLNLAFKHNELNAPWHEWARRAGASRLAEEEQLLEKTYAALARHQKVQADALGSAIHLLAILWIRWSDATSGVRAEVRAHTGDGRSLDNVFTALDRRSRLDARAAISGMLKEQVVEAHLVIAARKLAATGKFTYRFTISDGKLSDGTTTAYGYTNPRLFNLGRFLRDAKLCEHDRLTPAGLSFLDENQPA